MISLTLTYEQFGFIMSLLEDISEKDIRARKAQEIQFALEEAYRIHNLERRNSK